MNRLYEIAAVLLLCLIGLGLSDSFVVPVAIFLCTVIIVIVVNIIEIKPVTYVAIAALSFACVWIPILFCMLPLLAYVALNEGNLYLVLPSLIVFKSLTDGEEVVLNASELTHPLDSRQYLIAVVGAVIAIILSLRLSHLEEANKKLRSLRDEVAEKNDRLSAQNERLAEAQDNEVHLATLKERNRIAREIHDNVGHMLTRSLLQVGAILVATPDDSPMKENLTGLKDTLDTAMNNVRESVHDLHDESIDLRGMIEESVRAAKDSFEVTVEYDLSENIPPAIKLGMVGIIREAVSNAIRHSKGDKLMVKAVEHPGFYELIISDNGKNNLGNEIIRTGIGLSTMEERAQEMHGRIKIDRRKDGFEVMLTVPK